MGSIRSAFKNWFRGVHSSILIEMLEVSSDPTRILEIYHRKIDKHVVRDLILHSYFLAETKNLETGMTWADLALRASTIGGGTEEYADCLDLKAALLHDLFDQHSANQAGDAENVRLFLSEALECAKESLRLYEAVPVLAKIPVAQGRISILCAASGALLEAIDYRLSSMAGWARLSDAKQALPKQINDLDRLFEKLKDAERISGSKAILQKTGSLSDLASTLDPENSGILLEILGDACDELDNEQEALRYWSSAIEEYQVGRLPHREFFAWARLQDHAYKLENPRQIIKYGTRCMECAPTDMDPMRLAYRIRLNAFAHKVLEEKLYAINAYLRAAEILLPDSKGEAGDCLLEAGVLEIEAGHFIEAQNHLEQALKLPGGVLTYWLANQALAEVFWKGRENFGKAIKHAECAVDLSIGMSLGLAHRAKSCFFAGVVHFNFGDTKRSLHLFESVLKILDKNHKMSEFYTVSRSWYPVVPPTRAEAAFMASITALQLDQVEKAKVYWDIYLKHSDPNAVDDRFEFSNYPEEESSFADFLILPKADTLVFVNPAKAISLVENLLSREESLSRLNDFLPAAVNANRILGLAWFMQKDFISARIYFDNVLRLLADSPDIQEEVLCRHYLAMIEIESGNASGAYSQFKENIRILESQRESLTDEEQRLLFIQSRMGTYLNFFLICIELDYIEEAMETVERIKSRVLRDLLSQENKKPIDYGSIEKIRDLRKEREDWNNEWLLETSHKKRDDLINDYLERGVDDIYRPVRIQEKMDKMQRTLLENNFLIELDSSDIPLTFPETRSLCSSMLYSSNDTDHGSEPRRMVLVEYFVVGNETFAFGVREDFDKPKMIKIGVSQEEIRQCVLEHAGPEHGIWDWADWQRRFNRLLDPVAVWTDPGDVVCLVCHDALHSMPIHALKIEDRYLIERNPVCYTPSASVLKYCRANRTGRRDKILVMANSRIDKLLPGAELEAEVIAELFGADSYTRTRANKSLLKKKLNEENGEIDILHFACHGKFRADQALRSKIFLAPEGVEESDQDEKWDLTAHEIFRLSLKTDLVTLSACESGINENRPGDELLGLTRAFIYAGAASIVASKWRVDDYSTRILMESFYRGLKDGKSKVVALQHAQLLVMNLGDRFANPYYWAPFALIGDWD